jgi:hypothetical protein
MDAAVDVLLSAFDRLNLVALGERHWAREDAAFRLSLIRHPAFAQKVNDIVIEFANPLYQTLLDRFVNGGEVESSDLQKVWQDTTQPGAWDSPVYEEFIVAVRSLNAGSAADHRLRVLAADYPVDWRVAAAVHGSAFNARDEFAASLIRREVLDRGRKGLIVFGAAHLYRSRPGTVIELLRNHAGAESFVVVPAGGPNLPDPFAAIEATSMRPALLAMNSKLARIEAADVLEKDGKRIKVVDGKSVFENGKPVFIPVFEAGVKLGDLVDACLYFGDKPPEFVQPSSALYEGTQYGLEVQRRRAVLRASLGWPLR